MSPFAPFRGLERIPFEWNGLRSNSFSVAHVLFGKPVSTFPEHALVASPIAYYRDRQQSVGRLRVRARPQPARRPKTKLPEPLILPSRFAHVSVRGSTRRAKW
jgi:hypothetical protein